MTIRSATNFRGMKTWNRVSTKSTVLPLAACKSVHAARYRTEVRVILVSFCNLVMEQEHVRVSYRKTKDFQGTIHCHAVGKKECTAERKKFSIQYYKEGQKACKFCALGNRRTPGGNRKHKDAPSTNERGEDARPSPNGTNVSGGSTNNQQ